LSHSPQLSALALLVMPLAAYAQDYPRVAPPTPPAAVPAPLPTPPPPRRPTDPSRVIIRELKGIRLIASLRALDTKDGAPPGVTSDVRFAAPTLRALQSFIGKPLTLGTLAQIQATVTFYYRAHHRPFVAVDVPRQDVTDGVVQIVVTEYRVGNIRVLKNRWFSDDEILGAIRLKPGETIDAARLEADLSSLNANPFRTVDLVVAPGAQVATTDLDLIVHDRFPLSVYAGYADDGSPATGLDRWKFGALWGNAFGTGQQLGYQFTASDDFFGGRPAGAGGPSFLAQALTATIQLPWRHTLQIFGDYEQANPNVGPDFNNLGHSGQVSLRYIIPLPPRAGLAEQVSLGYDFKTTNNNLDFGGTAVSAQSSEIDQFPIAYQGTLRDRAGQTTLTDALVLSPGGLTPRNTDAAFEPGLDQTGVAFAKASYAYDRLDLERDTRLPRQWTWIVKFTGQLASGNLLPSEQLNIGGTDTVRGFPEEIVGGAEGVLASGELRPPPFKLLSTGDGGGFQDVFQPDLFVDYGRVWNVHAIADTPAAWTLASAGFGFRYALARHLSLHAEVGFPFDTPPGVQRRVAFANLEITLSL
jgi:hemolysin activation/secretion protein